MPRYYCDYCDTHLTHDSPSVRKQHCAGYKHKANVRQYYQQFEEQQTQTLIDQKVKEHLAQREQAGGAVYSLPGGGQYRPNIAVAAPPGLLPLRPPVLAPPAGPPSGYGNGAPPGFRPPVTQYYGSNGAPQYSAPYQSSGGGSQEYANGPARVPLPSTYNQGPVYQR